ncbi:MAG: DUF2079 domain-containing protein [bacterium]
MKTIKLFWPAFLYIAVSALVLRIIFSFNPGLVKTYLNDYKTALIPVAILTPLLFFLPAFEKKLPKKLARWDILAATGVITAFTCIYALFAVGQYGRYESDAWDLGIYSQAVYHLSQGEAPAVSFKAPFREGGSDLSRGATRNFILQDHFEPILLLLAPFYRVWPSPALLLLVQLIMVCFVGAWGVFLLSKKLLKSGLAAILILIGFYFFTGVQIALNSDFHSNTLSVAFFPWIILCLENNKLKRAFFLSCLALLFNEVVSIFIFAIGFFALFRRKWRWGFLVMLTSFAWFMIVTKWVIPSFGHNPYAYASEYPFSEIIRLNLGIKPLLTTIFFPHVKVATILQHLFSTGFLALFSPAVALLAPSFLRAFLHPSYFVAWGISRHYWVESFMFAGIAVIYGIKFLTGEKKLITIFLALLFVSQSIYHGLTTSTAWFGTKPMRYYFEYLERLRPTLPTYVLNSVIKNYIPKNAKVAAQNTILPHMANRGTVYLLPQVFDAEYVIFNTKDQDFAPLDENSRLTMIEEFASSSEWDDIFDFEGIRLFKKKQ